MDTKTETVMISKANALLAMESADQNLKPVLATLLGINKPQKWQDIKAYEDACLIVPPTENQSILLVYNGQDKDMLAVVAFMKLTIISRAMNKLNNNNQEWKPDWSNTDEGKYYPWLKYIAGSGFSVSHYGCAYAFTAVGSRLCYMTSEMARYAAVQFNGLYNDLFTL